MVPAIVRFVVTISALVSFTAEGATPLESCLSPSELFSGFIAFDTESRFCVRNMQPGTKYEVRISSLGSTPVKWHLGIVRGNTFTPLHASPPQTAGAQTTGKTVTTTQGDETGASTASEDTTAIHGRRLTSAKSDVANEKTHSNTANRYNKHFGSSLRSSDTMLETDVSGRQLLDTDKLVVQTSKEGVLQIHEEGTVLAGYIHELDEREADLFKRARVQPVVLSIRAETVPGWSAADVRGVYYTLIIDPYSNEFGGLLPRTVVSLVPVVIAAIVLAGGLVWALRKYSGSPFYVPQQMSKES